MKASLHLSVVLALCQAPLLAQTPIADLSIGDPLPGGHHVAEVLEIAMDDAGHRWAWIRTETSGVRMLVRDDDLVLVRGQALAEPAGSELMHVNSLGFDRAGNVAAAIGLRAVSPRRDTALYWQQRLLAQQGQIPGYPGAPADREYEWFGRPHPRDGAVVVRASLRDIGSSFEVESMLVRFDLDPAGAVLGSERLVGAGDILAGTQFLIDYVSVHDDQVDANERGDWSARVSLDGVGDALLQNGVIVASDGAPSPIPGVAYDLSRGALDLNDRGELAFTAQLGDDAILVDGTVFVRAGDVIDGLELLDFSDWPIALSNSGALYWSAVTRDALGASRAAYFRGREAVLVAGVSTVEGRLVTEIHPELDDAFVVSASGRFFAGWAVLDGLGQTLVRLDFGAAVPVAGCGSNRGTLRLADGLALAGHTITVELDGAPAAGMSASVLVGAPLTAECGIALPFGELLVDPSTHLVALPAGSFAGFPLPLAIAIPADPTLVGLQASLQGVFLDRAHSLPGADVALTSALRLEIGAP